MAKIDKNDEFIRDFPVPTSCHLCSAEADVYWIQDNVLSLCRECAVSTLPRVMADAVVQTASREANVGTLLFDELQKIERQFWTTALNTKRPKT